MNWDWSNLTLGELIVKCCYLYQGQISMIFQGREISYDELIENVNQLSKGLISLGVRNGDKIGVLMGNRPEWIFLKFAIASTGAITVPINGKFLFHEMEYVMRNADVKFLFLSHSLQGRDHYELVQRVNPDIRYEQWSIDDKQDNAIYMLDCQENRVLLFEEVLSCGLGVGDAELDSRKGCIKAEDTVNILYTSGTTSFPKGVMLSHRNLIEHMYYVGKLLDYSSEDRILLCIPLYGSYGLITGVIPSLIHGASVVLQEYFVAEESLRLIEECSCTTIHGVDTLYNALIRCADRIKFNGAHSLLKGTGIVTFDTAVKIVERLNVKHFVRSAYGSTEVSALATFCGVYEDYDHRMKYSGKPLPGVAIKIVDVETKSDLKIGQIGEICVRGNTVMKGYYKLEEESAKVFDQNGWFYTGDLGELDDSGYLIYRGRIKEMFKPNGFNVSALEVEDVIRRYEKVEDAYVVGVPDNKMGEAGLAIIKIKTDTSAEEQEIINFCRQYLAGFKVPKHIRFCDDFPLTSTGKVQKLKLREEFMKEMGLF